MIMSRKALARRLGVHEMTLYRWEAADKTARPRKVRGRIQYTEADFERLSAWMAETEEPPRPEPNVEIGYHLDMIEGAHRTRCGTTRKFCYWPTPVIDGGQMHRLSIVEEGISGHWPITEDFEMGSEREMRRKADELNRRRLDLSERATSLIVASSMSSRAAA